MKKLITTAIPYMNGVPHIGHALEVILTDVIARGYRLLGEDVFFLTGADEHGSKILRTAEAKGQDVMEMLDINIAHFTAMNAALAVSNDGYIRTTDQIRHWPIVQALWMRLVEKGDIYKKTYAGWYCDREERFVTEEELDENKCLKENGAPTRWTEDENYFFKLSKYSDIIKEKLLSGEVKITPEFRQNEMVAMIGNGLEDVSFSRTKKQLTWGIPVPNDPEHVMYVWCDALTNYISGAMEEVKGEKGKYSLRMREGKIQGPRFQDEERIFDIGDTSDSLSSDAINSCLDSWSCDLHVIGKDIARFHCLTWIGMLLSAEINLPKNILVHGFVNDKDGAKMSKSVGNVVDPHVMIDEYGSDTVRLYMTSEVGVGQDLNFSDERIKSIHNDVLANNYGNLVNRVISLWLAYQEKEAHIETLAPCEKAEQTGTDISEHLGKNFEGPEGLLTYDFTVRYSQALHAYNTQGMFAVIRDVLDEANNFINTHEPWKKSGQEKEHILLCSLSYVQYVTLLLSPFIPDATSKVRKAMNTPENMTLNDIFRIDLLNMRKPDILFVKK